MHMLSKKFFTSHIENLLHQCFLHSVQNNPDPQLFDAHEDSPTSDEKSSPAVLPNADTTNISEKESVVPVYHGEHNSAIDLSLSEFLFYSRVKQRSKKDSSLYLYWIDSQKTIHCEIIPCDRDPKLNMPPYDPASDTNFHAKLNKLTFNREHLYMITDGEINAIDRHHLEIQSSQRCHYLYDCFDMTISGSRLFIASAGFDSILVFDLMSQTFVEGYHINHNQTANCIYLAPFDPNAPADSGKGPPMASHVGLHSLFIKENKLFFSCSAYSNLFYAEPSGALHRSISIPLYTQFIRPFKKGLVLENREKKAIQHLTMEGDKIESFDLSHIDTPLAQLTTISDDIIVAALKNGKIILFEPGNASPVKHFDFEDLFNHSGADH